MSPTDSQVIVAVLSFLTFLGGGFIALMIRRQDRKDSDLKEERDVSRRLRDTAERKADAVQVKAEIIERAEVLAKMLVLQDQVRRMELDKNHVEGMQQLESVRLDMMGGIGATQAIANEAVAQATEAGVKADGAFHEANKVNNKIADLQENLVQTIAKIPTPAEVVVAASSQPLEHISPETIIGTFVGTRAP